jgi:hypothetical protein
MAVNAVWHAGNPMPPNPSLNQRITWHLKHASACGCRPIPDDLMAEIRRRSAGQKLADVPAEMREAAPKDGGGSAAALGNRRT